MKKTEETITYLIEKENGKRAKITVPADWKVTFGPAARGSDKPTTGYNHKMPMALRFYENENKQRAIFTDVVAFRDLSIPYLIEEVKTQEKDGYMECDGVRKRTTFQATVKEWADPEEVKDVPQLPSDSQIFSMEE